jgi:glutaconate CoA-transferase, subunit B
VLEPRGGELALTKLHPGVTLDDVRDATGWELAIAPGFRQTAPPTENELASLRALEAA